MLLITLGHVPILPAVGRVKGLNAIVETAMRKRLSLFAIPLLAALTMGAAGGSPANAGVVSPPNLAANTVAQSDVVKADWRRHGPRRHYRGHHRGRHHGRRHYRPRSGIYLQFGGPRVVRPAYPRYRSLPSAHVRWCHNRYRSYRASDNTFQPYHGPRRSCRSPYL